MKFTNEHEQIRKTIRKIVDHDINPYVADWEAKEQFPAHDSIRHQCLARLNRLNNLSVVSIEIQSRQYSHTTTRFSTVLKPPPSQRSAVPRPRTDGWSSQGRPA